MSNIAEVVQNALLAAFAERSGRFQSIPHDQLRAYLLNSNPIAKRALSVALDAIPETEEVEYHNRAEDEKRKKMVPPLPKALGGTDPAVDGDENGLVYVTRTFRIDPKAYSSSNYRPLDDNGNPIANPAPAKSAANPEEEAAYSDLSDEGGNISVKEKVETEEDIKDEPQKGNAPIPSNKLPEPTAKEEEQEAENADISAMKEEVTEEVEEDEPTDEEKARRRAEFYKAVGIAEDEMPGCEDLGIVFGEYGEAVVMDEAVAMDRRASAGGARRNPTRQNCETTFENCRAKNPLFCRFHGPRLIELDIKKTLQLSGIRGQVSVTRDPSANNARAFKVTVACRPADREAVETVLDEFMAEPGITSTSERARGADGKLTNYYEVDEMENARPRGTMAERIESANALKVAREGNTPRRRRPPREEAVEEVQEVEREEQEPQRPRQAAEEPVQPQEQSAEQPQVAGGEESREAPANRATEPQVNGGGDQIEHFAGGVKARFSPSEKAAIERAKNDAIRDSNASPNDLALRAYAHSLSHFLGSQNSRYGRRNNALRGIRDDITKAELLEKAEARLAATADADHPERYEGTVKALEKIAELSGLGGEIEIDGATVRMRDGVQGGNGSEENRREQGRRIRREEPDAADNPPPDEDEGNAAEVANARREINEAEGRDAELDEFMEAANRTADNAQQRAETPEEAIRNHPLTDSDLDYAADALVDDGHYENRREARQTLINVLYEAGYDGERGRRQMISDARDLALQLRESQNAPRISQNVLARLDRVARMPMPAGGNEGENRGNGNGRPVDEVDENTIRLTIPEPEEVRDAATRLANAAGRRDVDALVASINNRLTGQEQIARTELNFIRDILGVNHPVTTALSNAYDEQQRRFAERERNRARGVEIPNPANVTIPTYGAAATPEEIESARSANREFWEKTDASSQKVRERVMAAASAMSRNEAVASADLSTAREAFRDEELEPTITLDEIADGSVSPFATQIGDAAAGCNCWKTVAAAICRMRGFKVWARGQSQASPVFAGTLAADGKQRATFKVSQTAMAKAYERINGASTAETEANLRRIAEGDLEGHPPTLPYPDGTVVSTWNGGHCTGAVLYKGKWFFINPYYGTATSTASNDTIARHCFTGFGSGYESGYIREVRNAVEEYNRQKAANPRFHFDAEDERKQHVLHFLALRQRMKRTNPNVTDEAVYSELPKDARWLELNGSFVIRPDQPLIKEIFGLAKLSD